MKWRKKPVVIDAVQYNGNNGEELRQWSGGTVLQSPVLEPSEDYQDGSYVQIKTLEGTMTGIIGDWIIKGVHGEYYPCKPDIFEKTYELADESPIKEDGEKREFTLNEMIEAYNAGEAAGDFDRQRKQRGALFNEYFKTKFRIDVRRGKKII